MGGHVFTGAAGAEARDEPHPDPGLAMGWGPVWPRSDHGQVRIVGQVPCPTLLAQSPGTNLDLSWVVLVCFLLNQLVGVVRARVSSEGQRGNLSWEMVARGA